MPMVQLRLTAFHPAPLLFRSAAGRRRYLTRPPSGGGGLPERPGDVVDEGMVVLRKRIREVEISERREVNPPTGWMEWEKRYGVEGYNSDVCEAVGLLQAFLLRTRPGVTIGIVVLALLSLLTSAAVVSSHLLHLFATTLDLCH